MSEICKKIPKLQMGDIITPASKKKSQPPRVRFKEPAATLSHIPKKRHKVLPISHMKSGGPAMPGRSAQFNHYNVPVGEKGKKLKKKLIDKKQVGGMLFVPPKYQTKVAGNTFEAIGEVMAAPQKGLTYLASGKYQTPSKAMDIQNPWGQLAIDTILDPINLLGIGIAGKVGEALDKGRFVDDIVVSAEKAAKNRAERMLSQEAKWSEENLPATKNIYKNIEKHFEVVPASEYHRTPQELGIRRGSQAALFSDAPLAAPQRKYLASHETGHFYTNSAEEANGWLSNFNYNDWKGRYLRGRPMYTEIPEQSFGEAGSAISLGRSEGVAAPGHANEIRERAAQLKDFIAYKKGIPLNKDFVITPKDLDYAIANYTKSTGLDNNITQMLSALKNKAGFLKEMNTQPLGLIPIAGIAVANKKHGGLIAKYQAGSTISERRDWLQRDINESPLTKAARRHSQDPNFAQRQSDETWNIINTIGSFTPAWPLFAANQAGREIDKGNYGAAAAEAGMIAAPFAIGAGIKVAAPYVKQGLTSMGNGISKAVSSVEGKYGEIVNAAKEGTLYKMNPWANTGVEHMAYKPITPNRAKSLLEENPLLRWTKRGKAENYLPVYDDAGKIDHYVVKNDSQLFENRGGGNTKLKVSINTKNGKKVIPISLNDILADKIPKTGTYISNSSGIVKIPRGYDIFGENLRKGQPSLRDRVTALVYKDAGYSNLSNDVRFTRGNINPSRLKEGPKATPLVLEADPEKIGMVGAPTKGNRLNYVPKDSGEFERGKTLIPKQSLDDKELTMGQGLNMLRLSGSRGYVPVTAKELQTIRETGQYVAPQSRVAKAIIGFDNGLQGLKQLPNKLVEISNPLNITNPISYGRGMMAGYKQPTVIPNQFALAKDTWNSDKELIADKLSTVKKIFAELTTQSEKAGKADLGNLLASSKLSGEEIGEFIQKITRLQYQGGASKMDQAKVLALRSEKVRNLVDSKTGLGGNIFKEEVPGTQLSQRGTFNAAPTIDLSKWSNLPKPSSFEKGYGRMYNRRQNLVNLEAEKRFNANVIPQLDKVPESEELIHALFRDNHRDTAEAIRGAMEKLKTSPKGMYQSAESLSSESYPATVSALGKLTTSDYKIVRGPVQMELNGLDDFNKLGIPASHSAAYVNKFLKRVNIEGKEFPAAYHNSWGKVEAPRIYVNKLNDPSTIYPSNTPTGHWGQSQRPTPNPMYSSWADNPANAL